MLDLAILGLLEEGPMHGYELRSRLVDLGFWRISFGSVYPGLRRLSRRGDIAVEGQGRRKVYRLTEQGHRAFVALLGDVDAPVDNSTEFRVRFSLFRYLPPAARVRFMQRRQAVLRQRVDMAEAALAKAEASQQPGRYRAAEVRRRLAVLNGDIEWLEALIEEEEKES